MSLRLFSDQCVPAEITETLRRHWHQVTLLREVLPIRSPDPVVIAKARELGAILLVRSFPKWGFGNASQAGKLRFGVGAVSSNAVSMLQSSDPSPRNKVSAVQLRSQILNLGTSGAGASP